ncbi:MAG: PDZ domain-containing protein [Gemmatimonadaceae bacterium]|nr:PDZ domain-containing protein [Gemmatimonadaceae bacterium]
MRHTTRLVGLLAAAVGFLAAVPGPAAAHAQQQPTRERTRVTTDTLVLRAITTGNETEVMRVVNELRSREANILKTLSGTPFERIAERRLLEEELARISREAFTVMSVIESRCLEQKADAPMGYVGVNISSEVSVDVLGNATSRSVITSVEPGSPAQAAGLQSGDRLLSIAGLVMREPWPDLSGVLEPGRNIVVRVNRDGTQRDLNVTVAARPRRWDPGCPKFERAIQPLRMGGVARAWVRDSVDANGERVLWVVTPEARTPPVPPSPATAPAPRAGAVRTPPTPPAAEPAPPAPMVFAYGTTSGGTSAVAYFAGVQLRALDDDWRGVLGLRAGTEGVLVNEVAPGSPAAAAGLKVGDVVTSVNGTAATSPLVVVRLLGLDEDQTATLRVVRARDSRTVTLRWGGGR